MWGSRTKRTSSGGLVSLMLVLAAAGALLAASPASAARTFWIIRPVPPADVWLSRAPVGPDAPPLTVVSTPVAGDLSQHWVLERRITRTLVNGKWVDAPAYRIRNRLSNGCIGMIGGGVQWRSNNQPLVEVECDPQRFPTITWQLYLGSRPEQLPRSRTTAGYLIRNTYSRKCLGAPSLNYASGTQLQQYTCVRSSKQRWRLGFFTVP